MFDLSPVDAAAAAQALPLGSAASRTSLLDVGPLADPDRMRRGGFCDAELLGDLWRQKARLDELFDAGQAAFYYQAREALCPAAGSGGSGGRRGNRACDKLAEVGAALGGGVEDALRPPPEDTAFLDVCGAPGAWSKFLFRAAELKGSKVRGFGFSLREGTNPLSCTWYPELNAREDFTALWGEDGSGNICKPSNVSRAVEAIGREVDVVVADGGFGVGGPSLGQHVENYQEIVASGVLLAEVVLALRTLAAGGCFVGKFFDTFSELTVGLLFVLAATFEEVKVVKPRHSRVVNSERYVVAKRFRGRGAPSVAQLSAAVQAAHESWPLPGEGGAVLWSGDAPRRVLPIAENPGTAAFLDSVRAMTTELCRQQAAALRAVVDRAFELRAEGEQGAPPTLTDGGGSLGAKRRRCGSRRGR